MAVVTRYFSTTGAGAANGTSWADRAALFSAGNWSTVITGFAFNGSDSLKALIGPGNYTCSQALATGLFANPPTVANPLVLAGCDSSGVLLALPDPDWTSNQPAWSDASLPSINTTTNIATISLANTLPYLIKFTASARSGSVIGSGVLSWCVVINSNSNVSSVGIGVNAYGCVVKCTGAIYSGIASGSTLLVRTRLEGVTGSSGTRHGLVGSSASGTLVGVTMVNLGGDGLNVTSVSTGQTYKLLHCTIANVGGTGIKPNSTAAQTSNYEAHNCLITGCGSFGIDAQSEANFLATSNRLRDNASGNFNGFDNYPTDLNNFTTDSDDATEYVDVGSGDFRIRNTAAIWGQGYGPSDQPSTGAVTYSRGRIVNS